MALHIDAEIERLASEISQVTGETETETVRRLLVEQRQSLVAEDTKPRDSDAQNRRIDDLMRWLREEVWPNLPPGVRGSSIPKSEWDALNEESDL